MVDKFGKFKLLSQPKEDPNSRSLQSVRGYLLLKTRCEELFVDIGQHIWVLSLLTFFTHQTFLRRSLDDRHCLINMTVFVLDLVHTVQDSERELAETDLVCTV